MTGNPDDLQPLATIKENMQQHAGNLRYTEAEFTAGFESLEADNRIMIQDDEITLI